MRNPFRLVALPIAIIMSTPALAHPGHGPNEVSPTHLITNPDRVGLLLVAGVIVFCIIRALRWWERSESHAP